MTKSKVTSEGEKVMTLLLDVIAAKGYEKSTYFHQANHYIGWLPRLEGTVHVNVSQILKFMPNYFFSPTEYPEIGTRTDAVDDGFFWEQGPVGGTGKIRFADWTKPYEEYTHLPNVAVFYEQAKALKQLLTTAGPSADQQKDLDFLLTIGHLFSLVVYGQLVLEQAKILDLDPALVDQIFVTSVRDFSAYAVTLHGSTAATGRSSSGRSARSAPRTSTMSVSASSGTWSSRSMAPTRCLPDPPGIDQLIGIQVSPSGT